jgi:hypothetical protein
MSDEVLRDLVVRMATDPQFAERVRSAPGGVAAEHGLTADQVEALGQLGDGAGAGGPSMLDARLSKSSLFFGGGLHVDAHGFDPPAPIEPTHGSGLHDPVGFLCDNGEPAPAAFGPTPADPAALLCCGFHPVDMGDGSVHPAGFFGDGHASPEAAAAGDSMTHGIVGPDHAIVGPDHPVGVPAAAAPISLLTGKIVAPVDSHAAHSDVIGPSDSHTVTGVAEPVDMHASTSYGSGGGEGVSHGIVGPDKPQIVGPDVPAAKPGAGMEHTTPTTYVQATAATVDPHTAVPDASVVRCNG